MQLVIIVLHLLPSIFNVKPHYSPYLKKKKSKLDLNIYFVTKPNELPTKGLAYIYI